MADKRITELTNEKLTLGDGDYTIVDSNEGTYKFKLKRIMDAIPALDDSLSQEGKAADAKEVGDQLADVKRDLNDKANTDGTYDGMTVGSSRQLLSEKYLLDEEPYLFRASGGDGADRVEECIVGGTVGWNQLFPKKSLNYTSTKCNISSSNDGVWAVTVNTADAHNAEGNVMWLNLSVIQSGHKYLFVADNQEIKVTIKSTGRSTPTVFTESSFSGANISLTYSANSAGNYTVRPQLIDLTAMFGPTIADYIYSLEQATAGAGVAWFRKYFPEDYYEYSAPTLRHVEGVSAKQIRDSDDNVKAIYPLDSSLTLRGIPKLTDGEMWFDGDKYNADGSVTRNTILRAYQSGDESLANAITDGTNTVVYSANASTETATPYTALQTLDPNGTEEFVSTDIVPVGHYSKYLENLRSKIEGLPKDFSTLIAPTEKAYKATQNYTVGSLLIVDNILYKVTSAIANGGNITPNTNVTATTLAAVIAAL